MEGKFSASRDKSCLLCTYYEFYACLFLTLSLIPSISRLVQKDTIPLTQQTAMELGITTMIAE